MKKRTALVGVTGILIGAGIAASVALAQDHKQDHKQPGGGEMPDMQAMMEAWQKASTPGPEHARLAKAAGTWSGKSKFWMMPDMPPTESTNKTVFTSRMGGRFMIGETKGKIPMGPGQEVDFEGFGIYGYNNTTKQYQCTWADNMGTVMMHFTGEASADGKTITWMSRYTDPMTGQESYMKEVEKLIDDNTFHLEFFGPGMDGKEFKMMEIHYTRDGAAK